jgi:hypothetical protein
MGHLVIWDFLAVSFVGYCVTLAGWRGSLGAILGAVGGAIVGTFLIPIPLIGTLIDACIGAAGGT